MEYMGKWGISLNGWHEMAIYGGKGDEGSTLITFQVKGDIFTGDLKGNKGITAIKFTDYWDGNITGNGRKHGY